MVISPLRYPGGKAKLYDVVSGIISEHKLFDRTYCEPYAGGAGLALKLLSKGFVQHITLNDIDPAIYAFWVSVLRESDRFCDLIEATDITVDEWHKQREIYESTDINKQIDVGFAAYFLNRTSRSGIIEGAGPIGGYSQMGTWKIDARFNKKNQIDNIKSLSKFSEQIDVRNDDAMVFIGDTILSQENFLYLDPPYYVKGSKLYKNFYSHNDHLEISKLLSKFPDGCWILSYDDVPEIREMYTKFRLNSYSLQYSAGNSASGSEVMYFSNYFASEFEPLELTY